MAVMHGSLSLTGERRPVIALFNGTQALGDFVMHHLTAATVARALDARLVVIYRDDRPYKAFCTRLNPYVTKAIAVADSDDAAAPLDWLGGRSDAAPLPFDAAEIEAGLHRPDLMLSPSMLDIRKSVGPPTALRIPDDVESNLRHDLLMRGLQADRWFVCLHVRETGYAWRRDMDTARCVSPALYQDMVDDIIDHLGGQVVRIGDPSMTPLRARDGFIDLGRADAPFEEQAYATARARYFVGTDSGPTQIAAAFKVPLATTNAIAIGTWNDGDVVLLKSLRLPDGRVLDTAQQTEIGISVSHTFRPEGSKLLSNSPEDLVAVSRHMFDRTGDCPGWRAQTPEPDDPWRRDHLRFPLSGRHFGEMADLVIWGHEVP